MSRRLALIEGQRAALAHAGDSDRMRRLEVENGMLRRQLAAAQQREAQLLEGAPAALQEHNAQRHETGERLQKAICELLEQHPGPRHGAAKRIYARLLETEIGSAEKPSIRAVQHHITQIRKAAVLHQ